MTIKNAPVLTRHSLLTIISRIILSRLLISTTFLTGLLFSPLLALAEQKPNFEQEWTLRISPSGEDVPARRQIVIAFDRPMVPIGRMERTVEEIPISITPKVLCQWRWLNTTSLACQLTEKNQLKPSTRYKLDITNNPKTTFRAQDGSSLAQYISHTSNRFRTEKIFHSGYTISRSL